jgi:hypothetical protein
MTILQTELGRAAHKLFDKSSAGIFGTLDDLSDYRVW